MTNFETLKYCNTGWNDEKRGLYLTRDQLKRIGGKQKLIDLFAQTNGGSWPIEISVDFDDNLVWMETGTSRNPSYEKDFVQRLNELLGS